MSMRFYSSQSIRSQSVELDGEQVHHLLNVCRKKVGDRVLLFDGSGLEAMAEIESASKRSVTLQILKSRERDRELPFQLVMAVALPKADRQKFLVEKLVELGVAQLIPLVTKRSVVQLKEKSISRIEKLVIESSKQCGRNRLMVVSPPQSLGDLISLADFESYQKLIATTHGEAKPVNKFAVGVDTLTLVGPEGGFSADENAIVQGAGFSAVQLGPRILRVETAATALASYFGLTADVMQHTIHDDFFDV